MIVAVVNGVGQTDQYMKFIGFKTASGIFLHVPQGARVIPEEEFWKVFKFVSERGNDPEVELILDLHASYCNCHESIPYFQKKFDIQRMLDSLQACRAQIHVVFH